MRFSVEESKLILIREDVRFRGGSGTKIIAGPANSSSSQLSRIGEALVSFSNGMAFHNPICFLDCSRHGIRLLEIQLPKLASRRPVAQDHFRLLLSPLW